MRLYASQYYDYLKKPQIFSNLNFGRSLSKHWSSAFKGYEYPSVIYCLSYGKKTVADTNMWTKYVPVDVWGLVGLCLIFMAILSVASGSYKKPTKVSLKNGVLFLNSLLK